MTAEEKDEVGDPSGKPEPRRARGALSRRIADQIRERILAGDLKPGSRVPERMLTEELGVSRTPLREAFKTLAAEGLVILAPNRGALVAEHTLDLVRHTVEYVEYLEAAAGELAAERATDAEIDEIAALTHEMRAAFLRRDRLSYYKLNQSVHNGIVEAARNDVLAHAHQLANARLFRVRFRTNNNDERWKTALEEHDRILEALEARDGPLLGKTLREHLSYSWARKGVDPVADDAQDPDADAPRRVERPIAGE